MAARGLVLRRRRVLLIDKARVPRDKVCGCCLGGCLLPFPFRAKLPLEGQAPGLGLELNEEQVRKHRVA